MKIVVSIAPRSMKEALAQIQDLRHSRDLVEIRVDYIKSLDMRRLLSGPRPDLRAVEAGEKNRAKNCRLLHERAGPDKPDPGREIWQSPHVCRSIGRGNNSFRSVDRGRLEKDLPSSYFRQRHEDFWTRRQPGLPEQRGRVP